MGNLVPVEFKNQRILTTKQLAEVYRTTEGNISNNFNNNINHFVKNKHYYLLEGDELREFKRNSYEIGIAPNVNKLYLWTERGANRHCKILDTDKAWEQFDNLEETYFRVKEQKIEVKQLSPELQAFKQIFDSMARQELEQKKLRNEIAIAKEETTAVKEDIENIKDIIVLNPKAAWRRECNRILNAIGKKVGNYKLPKEQVYEVLKYRGECRPKVLVGNLKKRAKANGMAPSKVEQLNILDVLENQSRLKEIYISIVKEMAIKNGIRVREVI